MKKRILFILLIAFLVFLYSCTQKEGNEQDNNKKAVALINLKDSFILKTIKLYIKEYKIDPKKSYVNIYLSQDCKATIDITYSISNLSVNSTIPSFYTIVDDFLVLIYSDIDSFKDQSQVNLELKEQIKLRHMVLENNTKMFDPPIWEIIKYQDRVEIIKNNFDEFELNYLPCGYKLKIDTLNDNNLILIKDGK